MSYSELYLDNVLFWRIVKNIWGTKICSNKPSNPANKIQRRFWVQPQIKQKRPNSTRVALAVLIGSIVP